MALPAAFLGLSVATVVAIWGVLKLVKWSLNAEKPEIRHPTVYDDGTREPSLVDRVVDVYKMLVMAVLVLLTWPGLAHWATSAGRWFLNRGRINMPKVETPEIPKRTIGEWLMANAVRLYGLGLVLGVIGYLLDRVGI
jgi:hypothetical protein